MRQSIKKKFNLSFSFIPYHLLFLKKQKLHLGLSNHTEDSDNQPCCQDCCGTMRTHISRCCLQDLAAYLQ